MKRLILLFLLPLLFFSIKSKAQIRNVIVEKYYVSDSLDATDTIDGSLRTLPRGSKTYRVFVVLDSGFKINKIYGDANHPLKISSTANFYNNIDRPTAYFGYLINKSWFSSNPTLALDSWLTIGLATKVHTGVLKTEDTDGSIIGGNHNGGGTATIAGGLLVNADTSAGIPIDTADGFLPNTSVLGQWSDNGFRNNVSGGTDTTIFGSVNIGSNFYSTTAYLQQNNGVMGINPNNNKVLVAQLTTTGSLSFELNLELTDSTATGVHTFNFVADAHNAIPQGDTTISPYLKYPPVCGCKDPNYLEYGVNYSCGNSDSCHTKIILGCMDTAACNYDMKVNFNVPSLCCYPGRCNDRDISLVCPGISSAIGFSIYPNPVRSQLTLQLSLASSQVVKYEIYDAYGTSVIQKELGVLLGNSTQQIDVSNLHIGLYLIRVYEGTESQSKSFMKN